MIAVQAPCPHQILRAIASFLGRSILCEGPRPSASLNHKALVAGQRSSWASGRWSRLGERCTPGQGVPNLQCRAVPFPAPRVHHLVPGLCVLAFL